MQSPVHVKGWWDRSLRYSVTPSIKVSMNPAKSGHYTVVRSSLDNYRWHGNQDMLRRGDSRKA